MAAKKKTSRRKAATRKKKTRKRKTPASSSKQFVILLDGAEEKPDSTARIELAAENTIADVATLHERLLAALDSAGAVTVDTAKVKRVDTAVLQLLCAFARGAASRELDVSWQHGGPAFADAARCLGLQAELGVG